MSKNPLLRRLTLPVAAAVLWLAVPARAGRVLPGSTKVEHKGQTSPLMMARVPEHHTEVLYGQDGLTRDISRGSLLAWGGIAGNRLKYGAAVAMTPLANSAYKRGWDPIAFENRIYDYPNVPAGELDAFLAECARTEVQMQWFYETLDFGLREIPADDPRQVRLFGRSLGAALLSEALHRYVLGDPAAAAMGRADLVVLAGNFGHLKDEIAYWRAMEVVFAEKYPEIQDVTVAPFGPRIYEGFGFANLGEPPPRGRPVPKKLPRVVFIIGAQDEFLVADDLVSVAERFSRLHPELMVTAYKTDTLHNPARELEYENRFGRTIKAETMQRLRPILLGDLAGEYKPGFHVTEDAFFANARPTVCPNLALAARHLAETITYP